MSEAELKHREQQLRFKEQELDLLEKNLHTTRDLLRMEHQTQTQTIRRISEDVAKKLTSEGHICVNGERITRIEENGKATYEIVKETRENQKYIIAKVEELFEARNSNRERIAALEVAGETADKIGTSTGNKVAIWIAAVSALLSFLTVIIMVWQTMEMRKEIKQEIPKIEKSGHVAQYNGIEAVNK